MTQRTAGAKGAAIRADEHPRTGHEGLHIILVHCLDKPLPASNGAPLRCRVERQLGYKQPKYVRAIELVASFDSVRGGKGGYWEDEGYEWYGGI